MSAVLQGGWVQSGGQAQTVGSRDLVPRRCALRRQGAHAALVIVMSTGYGLCIRVPSCFSARIHLHAHFCMQVSGQSCSRTHYYSTTRTLGLT